MKSSSDSLLRSRFTRRTATVTISAPLASIARAVSCPDLYFPVPTISLERNARPAMMRGSMTLFKMFLHPLPSRRRLPGVRLLIQLFNLLLILGFNPPPLQFQRGRDLAAGNGEFIRHQQDLFNGFKMRQLLVHVFDNARVQ